MMNRGLTRRQLLAISAGTLAVWLAELPGRLWAQGLTPLEASAAASVQGKRRYHRALTFQDVTHQVLGQQPQAQGWPCITVLDYDNDGWPDLLLCHNGDFGQPAGSIDSPSGPYPFGVQILKNNRNGTFTEVTSTVFPPLTEGVLESHWVFVAGDMDGDGVIEVWDGTDFGIPNHVFKTNTTPWTNITAQWGMQDPETGPSAATLIPNYPGADRGTLALLFSNYPPGEGEIDQWYLWKRINGVWTKHTVGLDAMGRNSWTNVPLADIRPYGLQFMQSGLPGEPITGIHSSINSQAWLRVLAQPTGVGPGLMWADMNQHPEQWSYLSPYGHDAEFVDINNDGVPDLLMADIGAATWPMVFGVILGANQDGGHCIPSVPEDAAHPYSPWSFSISANQPQSLAVADFDNDGHVDVFVLCGNGNVVDGNDAKSPDVLAVNNGDGTFTNMFTGSGLDGHVNTVHMTGGGAVAIDYDLNGLVDLVVGYNGGDIPDPGLVGPYKVYKNTTRNHGNFIGFALPVNADIGAMITISGKRFGPRRIQVTARTGWMRQSQRLVHFGLGAFRGPVDVQIAWPDGSRRTFTRLLANHYWRMTGGRLVLLK